MHDLRNLSRSVVAVNHSACPELVLFPKQHRRGSAGSERASVAQDGPGPTWLSSPRALHIPTTLTPCDVLVVAPRQSAPFCCYAACFFRAHGGLVEGVEESLRDGLITYVGSSPLHARRVGLGGSFCSGHWLRAENMSRVSWDDYALMAYS